MQHVTARDFLRIQDRMLAAIDSLEREFDAAVRQIAEETTDPVEREAVATAEYKKALAALQVITDSAFCEVDAVTFSGDGGTDG